MVSVPVIFFFLLVMLVAVPVGVLVVLYVIVPFFTAVGWLIRQVFRFVGGEIGDALRIVGSLITTVVLVPLVIANIVIGRWSASAHFGRAITAEFQALGFAAYRMLIGHPARLLCLTPLTDGIEHRLPGVVAGAPGSDRPAKRVGQFPGYRIVGSLPGGGSGSRLYVAQPEPVKAAALSRQGHADVGQVVIKCFSLDDGSSLPQIIREGRALEAAKHVGLVLDHELAPDRFYYVMRYVPGESMSLVTQRLHAASGPRGLEGQHLAAALRYGADLVRTLHEYHRAGLWHKDVKPDNIIVDGARAHLVDFGLVTPLRSAMTLTTHGTEYFRDPEMVRLALRGVKVHQVDGAKFDIYGAGAVLFSMIENSFPAHGGLSQITRKCPEAVRWIVRRAMTDYDKRYPSAGMMLADLDFVAKAADPFAVKPVDLPSMSGAAGNPEEFAAAVEEPEPRGAVNPSFAAAAPAAAFAGAGPAGGAAAPAWGAGGPRQRPRLRVVNWWTGRYAVDDVADERVVPGADELSRSAREVADQAMRVASDSIRSAMAGAGLGGVRVRRAGAPPIHRGHPIGLTAAEQLKSARARADAARRRARERMSRRRDRFTGEFRAGPNLGVAAALFIFLGGCVALAAVLISSGVSGSPRGVRFSVGPDGARVAEIEGRGVVVPVMPAPPAAEAGRAEPVARTASMRGAGALEGLSAVVLREPMAAATPAMASGVAAQLARLDALGLELLGVEVPGRPSAGGGEGLGLAADLRRTIGLSPFQSGTAEHQITSWLDRHEEIDFVFWIGRDPRDAERASTWIIRGEHVEDGVLALALEAIAG